MYESKFSSWAAWDQRNNFDGIKYPGIYAIRISTKNIEGRKFRWHKEIVYIGMTNAISGLKGRLKAFDNTIIGKRGHGGADRFRYKYSNYELLIKELFVSVAPFRADVTSNNPSDLVVMGNVTKFEYQSFAQYVELYGVLPEFNDKKRSKKYSLTYGK
jgi:hypothetical protein